jgi:hypothetical protein
MMIGLGPLLLLAPIIYPHQSLRRALTPQARIFSPSIAIVVAVLQWGVVALVFAIFTRRLSSWRQALIAPIIVLGVGIGVLSLASSLGMIVPIVSP